MTALSLLVYFSFSAQDFQAIIHPRFFLLAAWCCPRGAQY
jgi:hypothetical protein